MTRRASRRQDLPIKALDRREFPRKRVLFSGVILGSDAQDPIDCYIRDISARGAQVQVSCPPTLRPQLYLIDTRNEAAHLTTVAWASEHRLGLSFIHSYLIDLGLASELQFLKTVLVEAKLRQVRSLIERGLAVEEAASLVGLTENYLDRFDASVIQVTGRRYCR